MKLPETICIGYQDIEVIKTDFADYENGAYLSDRMQIRIQKGLPPRERVNTILHECLHAVIYVYGLKASFKDDDTEEKFVNAISNGMTEVFARNPELTEWVAFYASR